MAGETMIQVLEVEIAVEIDGNLPVRLVSGELIAKPHNIHHIIEAVKQSK